MKTASVCITCWASGSSRLKASPTRVSTTLSGSRGGLRQQLRQGGVPVGGQDRRQRLKRPRVAAGALPGLVEQLVGGGLKAKPPVGVPGPQYLLGVRRAQPLIQVQAALPLRLRQQQRAGRHPGGEDDLHPVRGSGQQRPQRLVERRIGDREIAGRRVDEVFKLVKQHHHAAGRERVEQRPGQRGRGLLRVAVPLQQPIGDLGREHPAQVGEQVGEVQRMLPGRAEVDDPVHLKLTEVIGQ